MTNLLPISTGLSGAEDWSTWERVSCAWKAVMKELPLFSQPVQAPEHSSSRDVHRATVTAHPHRMQWCDVSLLALRQFERKVNELDRVKFDPQGEALLYV